MGFMLVAALAVAMLYGCQPVARAATAGETDTEAVAPESWMMISSGGWSAWKFDGDEGMGRCPRSISDACGGSYVKRLYWMFPTARWQGATIEKARFSVFETWSASCSARVVQLRSTGGSFSESSEWGDVPDGKELAARDVALGYHSCAPGTVTFDDDRLTGAVAEAAEHGEPLYLELRAGDESDELAWKRFRPDALLQVTLGPAGRSDRDPN